MELLALLSGRPLDRLRLVTRGCPPGGPVGSLCTNKGGPGGLRCSARGEGGFDLGATREEDEDGKAVFVTLLV